jgi:NAD(P)-dependent dehydrogenase (short-subunit alcohol dehydrogenase family)
MQSLAAEFGEAGLRCSTILPGSILTDFGPRSVEEKRASGGTYLAPEDVAGAILYLLTQPPTAWTEEMNLWPVRSPA